MSRNYSVHPGTIMKYLLVSMGKNQKWLAQEMKKNKVVISDLFHGKRNVTPEIALLFEKATGYPANKLLNIQAEYDLFKEAIKLNQTYEMLKETNIPDYKINQDDFYKRKSTFTIAA